MTARPRRILVTGAEEHQGLAVVRGLGMAGIEVVACGQSRRSLAFRSRHAAVCHTYTSPSEDPAQFVADIIDIARDTKPALIMPSVETTLVVLNAAREQVEQFAPLAAPAPATLEMALDKARTLALARQLGVPAPATATGGTLDELLARSARLTFPLVVKPRGNALHRTTANAIGFKSRYAGTMAELERVLAPHAADAHALLVQEFAQGSGHCIAAVCKRGDPIALFAYSRDREFPLSGGVSVMRRSLPLADAARDYALRLLKAVEWDGVAMVEFKHDRATNKFTLMEINGRFQASTALSLDAGLNLPLLAACVFTGWTSPAVAPYTPGVEERWLRGDLLALHDALGPRKGSRHSVHAAPSRRAVVAQFFRDFRHGVHFDEFRHDDPGPALTELRTVAGLVGQWTLDIATLVPRRVISGVRTLMRAMRRYFGRPSTGGTATVRS